ncbi:MAG: alpha/beta hydrolase [Bacteroidia bacterium]|nr:alpha/beta hydrolase [Bacteroidia bacterium]
MNNLKIFLLALCLFTIGHASSQDLKKIEGIWLGSLQVQSTELRLVMNVTKNEKDSFIVTFDSPDQGAKGIKTSEARVKGDSVIVKSKKIYASYKGILKDSVITGTWTQAGNSLPLSLTRTKSIPVVKRPQEPVPPFPYKVENVYFENEKAGVRLAGTLTLPQNAITSPAVVLITGSGPQDRDESIMGHKPFLVLADHLTRNGIAVLRYDDRGTGESTGKFSEGTTADFATDVMAALKFLRNHKAIDSKDIGLIGHSEGGIIAPMIAADDKDVAFIVMLAGPGLKGEEILKLQMQLIARADGEKEDEIKKDLEFSEKIWTVAEKNYKYDKAAEKIQEIYKKQIASLTAEEKKEQAYTPAAIITTTQEVLSPWFRYFLSYDPVPALKKVKCPVLALNGEKDLQVPPKENLAAIREALKSGGNSHFIAEQIEGLNHLFQYCQTGSPKEYSKIEETFNIKPMEIITGWIKTQLLH